MTTEQIHWSPPSTTLVQTIDDNTENNENIVFIMSKGKLYNDTFVLIFLCLAVTSGSLTHCHTFFFEIHY
jgi:hypothetical protein